ncbi:MAG: Zn-dependent protease [Bacteroidetes bacterium]|jgi:archaemetzincin|nr:Zn-dependent protease [Bacteroidota bacterium]
MKRVKKKFIFVLFLVTLAVTFSFKSKSGSTENTVIAIQPFSDLPSKYTVHVYKQLKKLYPNVIVLKPIDLPKQAYYSPRNRYRADSIISYLRKQAKPGQVILGLTGKDISTTKGNIKDYGIMGLGYQPGKSCVVSYFRLSKKNTLEQFFKVSIHELGHTQGLPHCPAATCFMRDAKGENHNDEEHEFCTKCKAHLESKGWSFK